MRNFKQRKMSSGEDQVSLVYFWWIWLRIFVRQNIFNRFRNYKKRRPHRSFRLTRRRDYIRPLKIAGYWSFTRSVFRLIRDNKKQFYGLMAVIALFNFILIGLLDQDFITSLQAVADTTNGGLFSGFWGEVGKAGLVVMSTFSTGGLVKTPSQSQQIVMFLIFLFSWLAVIQLCRNIFSGRKKISLRDSLYSCGAPVIPIAMIALVILVQLIPAFFGIIIASAASLTNFAVQGIEQMIFTAAVLLLFSVSIYWVLGSIFAMIIVSIPGTYPSQALKISGDMMIQRRLAILFRIIWCAFIIVLLWAFIILPLVMIYNWLLQKFDFLKFIPVLQLAMVAVSSYSMVFLSVYIYTLYRKIVDYDRKN